MSEAVHRVLRLLSLLEARATWTGPELADRLGVTTRTVRRDVERLRQLGYPVEGERGLDGGYRLGVGLRLPPLLLDDDEAVALVACLRMAALGGDDSLGEAALRSLSKLDRMLPPRLRADAEALDRSTVSLPAPRPDVDWERLSLLARAVRDGVRVRFDYADAQGALSARDVEPARLVTQGRLWYLQAFDRARDDWRTFRLDRMAAVQATTFRFQPRPVPPLPDAGLRGRWSCVGVVAYDVPPDAVAARIPAAYYAELDAPPGHTRLRAGASDWDDLAWHLLWAARDLGATLTVEEPDELRDALRGLAARFLEAAGPPGPAAGEDAGQLP